MSLDTTAIFQPGPDFPGLPWLCERLRVHTPPGVAAVAALLGHLWLAKEWRIEPNPEGGKLFGPGGFAICGGTGVVDVYHLLPFARFTSGSSEATLVRAALLEIAGLTGATRAILTHELLGWGHASTLDEAIANLSREFPPAATEDEFDGEYPYSPGCWRIVEVPAELRAPG